MLDDNYSQQCHVYIAGMNVDVIYVPPTDMHFRIKLAKCFDCYAFDLCLKKKILLWLLINIYSHVLMTTCCIKNSGPCLLENNA